MLTCMSDPDLTVSGILALHGHFFCDHQLKCKRDSAIRLCVFTAELALLSPVPLEECVYDCGSNINSQQGIKSEWCF